MENNKVFILLNKRDFSRVINIFVVNPTGKIDKRNVKFTTERLVDAKQRQTAARKVAAEYWAKNDAEVEALLSSSGYGITFVRKDDPMGILKKQTRMISTEDAERAALKALFEAIGLEFDEKLTNDVLKSQYAIHAQTVAGTKKVAASGPKQIIAKPVDVAGEIAQGKQQAKNSFKEKYGYEVPDVVANDVAFLDALSNPDFDAEKYIENVTSKADEPEDGPVEDEKPIDYWQEKYSTLKGTKVPNPKKNDIAWIKAEVAKMENN